MDLVGTYAPNLCMQSFLSPNQTLGLLLCHWTVHWLFPCNSTANQTCSRQQSFEREAKPDTYSFKFLHKVCASQHDRKARKKNLKENLYFNFIEHKSKYVCSSDGWSQCKFVLCLFLLLRALGKGPDQGMAKTGICPATASSHDWSHWLRTCWSVQCDWSSCLAIE